MPIFPCPNPNCERTWNVNDRHIGQTAPCPDCTTSITVPSLEIADLMTKAKSGDAEAMLRLAKAYLKNNEVAHDFEKAVQWQENAVHWLEKAANLGNAKAQFEMANYLRAKGDLNDALDWDMKAAEQDWPKSQYNLGVCFRDGIGTSVDLEKSFFWYRKAAKNGVTDAKLSLAICYLLGNGTAQDFPQAIYWLQQASDEGNAEAMMRLGAAYIQGIGCEIDVEKGNSLLRNAAKSGNKKAKELNEKAKELSELEKEQPQPLSPEAADIKSKLIWHLIYMAVGGIITGSFFAMVNSAQTGRIESGMLFAGVYFGVGLCAFKTLYSRVRKTALPP